uniref:Uncharacterized protein n=1 Tax=Medicago truncatula TaxID=3880 RepID=Q1S5I6_MEDTR|nr:hypothetical protein MtrDRAFT_AC147431g7v2 [Medicago truncatula]
MTRVGSGRQCTRLWMGDLLGSFPKSVRVRTKHTEKTCVGLWGQSAILKVVWMKRKTHDEKLG